MVPSAPRTGWMRTPVRGYVGLIGLMGLTALLLPAHPGQGLLRLGAGLFVLSDLMLALQLFVPGDLRTKRRLALMLCSCSLMIGSCCTTIRLSANAVV